jgi:geranyl-CoA carboxylase alpha subunit
MQLQVAQGYALPLSQGDVVLRGHAIEARLYAEDPGNEFLPSTGTAHLWRPPVGEGIRVDHGLRQGQAIAPFYDPMVAKIIAWGEDRDIARRRLVRALHNTCLFGPASNRAFLIDVLGKDVFIAGEATTAFIPEHYPERFEAPTTARVEQMAIAACLLYRDSLTRAAATCPATLPGMSGFKGTRAMRNHYRFGGEETPVDVLLDETSPGHYRVSIDARELQLQWLEQDATQVRLNLDAVQLTVQYALPGAAEVIVQLRGEAAALVDQLAFTRLDETTGGGGTILAPMHGNVLAVLVAVGDTVEVGQDVAVMEAMKMEHRLSTPVAGEVIAVHTSDGQQLASGALVLEISPAP